MEYYEKVHKDMTKRSIRVEHNRSKHLKMTFYHSHSDFELLYIRGGRASVTNNSETVELSAPTLVLHHPYMLHRAASDGIQTYERYIVYFSKELIGKFQRWIPDFSKRFVGCMSYLPLEPTLAERLDRYFEEMERCYESGNINRCEILLMLFWEEVLSSTSPNDIRSVLEKRGYISEVLVYIADRCEQDLTVESLAKQFYVSRTKLAADFKDYTGMTVKQYILLTRINHAKHLLSREEMTLSQVARRCGFCDDAHFINTFRRFEGVTPKEYLAVEHRSDTIDH